jgi:unsaturated chondroitin disaccharide hydrolase
LELSGLVKDQEESDEYYSAASQILKSLSDNYLSGTDNYAILNHSVGNFNTESEVDIPIIYADYYYIEALLRKRAIDNQK